MGSRLRPWCSGRGVGHRGGNAGDPPHYRLWETPDDSLALVFAGVDGDKDRPAPDWDHSSFGDADFVSGKAGIPTVQFGPRGGSFHQADEWVDVSSIAASVRVLVRLALALLAAD